MEELEKPKHVLPLEVRFELEERSGDKVFELTNVTKKLPEHNLGPINLTIQYGDRILILGNNGSGKSTLIKLLLGSLTPDSGEVIKGTKLNIGYLPQEEDFNADATLREEFLRLTEVEEGMGRRTLNRFKLSENDVHKKVSELSSGEKSRLMLAIIMANKVNCLILDEPSNHIDLEVLESLEEALKDYKGTLILVSHDRYLIKRIDITTTLVLENGGIKQIPSYAHYEEYALM
jgi:ATPase subunit of ABC transporter with duplicated ATPase domains